MTRAEEQILDAINKYNLLSKDESVLVGFSGGSDSVCLLSVLHNLGYNVIAAHMNHGMRESAVRDMEFCKAFCSARNIPLEIKTMPPGTLKSEDGARKARYDFFAEVIARHGIERLATAHNKNDSAETVLLHLLRGASTDGLRGIQPKNGILIRPMLGVKKSEVLDYCKVNNLEYMTDETNLGDVYSRNKLRNRIIPVLEREFNPALVDAVADNALITANDADYLRQSAEEQYNRLQTEGGIEVKKLLSLHPSMIGRVIQLMWRKSGGTQNLGSGYVDDICRLAKNGKNAGIDLPCKRRAYLDYGRITIEKCEQISDFCYPLRVGEWTDIPEIGRRVRIGNQGTGEKVSLNGDELLFVRNFQPGDSFIPRAMNGTKKLSDYFADRKIPSRIRKKVPVICTQSEIVSVANYRAAQEFSMGKRAYDYYINIEPLGKGV